MLFTNSLQVALCSRCGIFVTANTYRTHIMLEPIVLTWKSQRL